MMLTRNTLICNINPDGSAFNVCFHYVRYIQQVNYLRLVIPYTTDQRSSDTTTFEDGRFYFEIPGS